MNGFPWLTLLIVVPLLGAVATAALPAGHKAQLPKLVALGASLVTLVGAIAMAAAYDTNGARFQFVQSHDWITSFGAHYAVGVDGIGLALILMTAVLTPVIVLSSWHEADMGERSIPTFFALMLATEASMTSPPNRL